MRTRYTLRMTMIRGMRLLALGTAMLLTLALPLAVHAQASSTELRETVRAALLSDPRTASMTDAQLDAMVNVLTAQAQRQGVTAHDILWRPQPAENAGETGAASLDQCSSLSFFCMFNRAFGFSGNSTVIPLMLGGTSAVLLLLTGMMIEHYRKLRALQRASIQ